jgi:hypothetical protein
MRGMLMPLALTAAAYFAISPAVAAIAGPPDFSGNWRLDPSKSQETNGAIVTLSIQNEAGNLKYERTLHERNGREVVARFTCAVGATQCDFDENGHKAKVSLWYDGSALMILKTNGLKEDERPSEGWSYRPTEMLFPGEARCQEGCPSRFWTDGLVEPLSESLGFFGRESDAGVDDPISG